MTKSSSNKPKRKAVCIYLDQPTIDMMDKGANRSYQSRSLYLTRLIHEDNEGKKDDR